MDTHLMLGNEAVARGAWEAGVQVAAAYPGTPSTEIVTNLARYDGVYAEWSTNEKVAYEVAFGAAMGGARALTAMKSAGASVAADPLISSVYTGICGGLVVIVAGDPGMSSGMTEQDDRYFGRISSMPMLEPADSQECHDFTRLALELSETYDVPVMVRLSIQTAHQKSIVRVGEQVAVARKDPGRHTDKYCLLPRFSRPLHASLLERVARLREYAEASPLHARGARHGRRSRASASSPPAPPTSAPARRCPAPRISSSASCIRCRSRPSGASPPRSSACSSSRSSSRTSRSRSSRPASRSRVSSGSRSSASSLLCGSAGASSPPASTCRAGRRSRPRKTTPSYRGRPCCAPAARTAAWLRR